MAQVASFKVPAIENEPMVRYHMSTRVGSTETDGNVAELCSRLSGEKGARSCSCKDAARAPL